MSLDLRSLLRKISIFEGIADRELDELVQLTTTRRLRKGEIHGLFGLVEAQPKKSVLHLQATIEVSRNREIRSDAIISSSPYTTIRPTTGGRCTPC